MRQDNSKNENDFASMLDREADRVEKKQMLIGIEKRIQCVANDVIRELKMYSVSVYNVREEYKHWHLYFDGILTTEERKKIIPLIAKKLNISNDEIEFIGYHF